jgi:hypothetical protein
MTRIIHGKRRKIGSRETETEVAAARAAGLTADVIHYGKVAYEPGAPKSTPRWVWRCGCDACMRLPDAEAARGPFKTRREAEKDAEQAVSLLCGDTDGSA